MQIITERPARPIPEAESVAGVDDGDGGNDWEPDTTTGIPPGVDPGDVLTWDGDSWEPEAPATVTREWELWNEGGDPMVHAHGSFGASETIDPTLGNVHTGTLDADCTVTISAPSGTAATLLLELTQDGTGGWDITWGGTVAEIGTHDTTAGTTQYAIAVTTDGGSTWVVAWVGSGPAVTYATPAIVLGTAAAAGAADSVIRSDATIVAFDATAPTTQAVGDSASVGAAAVAARRDHKHAITRPALDDLSDATITTPASADRLRYNGSAWVNSPAIWVPVMVEDGATGLWYVAVTGDGDAVMTEVP